MGAAFGSILQLSEPPVNSKVLLIGETGSGKTSFLNLLCNYGLAKELGFEIGVEHFHLFNDIQLENAVADKMESKTSDAKKYTVSLGDTNLEIIDTPGFGDSRGIGEDKKRMEAIMRCLKNEEDINCVCLVINGRASRISATFGYVLCEITSILPRAIIDNIIVVFTNTTDFLQLNFEPQALQGYFGQDLQNCSFCIENPYCLLEKANERKGLMSRELLTEALKDDFERAAKNLIKIFTHIKSLGAAIKTEDFMRSYEKKNEIEALLTEAFTMTSGEEKDQIEKKLFMTIKELERLSICRSFIRLLMNRVDLMSYKLEGEDPENEREELIKKKEELVNEIIYLRKAISKQ